MLYMDEVAGYFPPVANPPSKPPMLTLLKQARAFGLGITLATQNPVDLDYKGLSNIGTWFLGRLQTERDKARVLEGLEGAAIQSGQQFDRGKMEAMLAALGKRVFLLNNVHDDGPTIFQTRWAMSFLAGPLARGQIQRLMADRKAQAAACEDQLSEKLKSKASKPSRPVVPAGIEERFIVANKIPGRSTRLVYRSGLYDEGTLHFVRSSADVDMWKDVQHILGCGNGVPDDLWESSFQASADIELVDAPEEGFEFSELPDELMSKSKYRTFEKQFKDYLYRHHAMTLYKSPLLGEYAPAGLTEGEARQYFDQLAREHRDAATEKLREKFAAKMKRIDDKIETAEARVQREEEQYNQAKMSSIVSFGASILGAFLGNKMASRTNVSKVSTAVRGAGRAAQQRGDVNRAEDQLKRLAEEMTDLDAELREEIDELDEKFSIENLELDPMVLPPRKSDLKVTDPVLVWLPWQVDSSGIATRLID